MCFCDLLHVPLNLPKTLTLIARNASSLILIGQGERGRLYTPVECIRQMRFDFLGGIWMGS
jgi:hypothetical protein